MTNKDLYNSSLDPKAKTREKRVAVLEQCKPQFDQLQAYYAYCENVQLTEPSNWGDILTDYDSILRTVTDLSTVLNKAQITYHRVLEQEKKIGSLPED